MRLAEKFPHTRDNGRNIKNKSKRIIICRARERETKVYGFVVWLVEKSGRKAAAAATQPPPQQLQNEMKF